MKTNSQAFRPTLAVFTKNRTNPAYEGARLGADRVAARFGARTVHYVPEKPDDVDEQIALIERAIVERPDAAVFVPVHETAVNDWILKLNAAGIPLVSLIAPTTAGERVTFIGSDDYVLAAAIARRLAAELNGQGSVLVLEGSAASSTSRPRSLGIALGLTDYPGIRTVASVRGDYQRDVARRAVAQLIANRREFDAVIAANDTMALGALDALAACGRKPLPVVGVNAIPEAVEAIKRGRLLATADFDAMKMACIATEAAVRHLRGESVPPRIMLPVQIVDASNCSHWDRPYASRELPSWSNITGSQ